MIMLFRSLTSVFLGAVVSGAAYAQTSIRIAAHVWDLLDEQERSQISEKFIVQKISLVSYGRIIDTQGVDKSTPGTTSGANLGGAVGNAIYTDQWLNGGNYSAKNQLAAILLGQLIGSTLDSKQSNLYHFRYAVRMGDGNIQYFDSFSSEPFRHPPGMCVSLPEVKPNADQSLCDQTVESIRSKVSLSSKKREVSERKENNIYEARSVSTEGGSENAGAADVAGNGLVIECKIQSLAPVKTTKQKCLAIDGVILND